ncbi:MAG TPA: helix-turn-helix domain-containing protein [Anaeromyxobacteraceae bacterium]|nr:helix-turn-helix domain-containing protein [Anaeromyxobacteraceae bacterium]
MTFEATITEVVRQVVREEFSRAIADLRFDRKPLSVPEAARELGVSARTLRRKIKSGEVPVIRVGRSVRIDMATLRKSPDEVARLAVVTATGEPR